MKRSVRLLLALVITMGITMEIYGMDPHARHQIRRVDRNHGGTPTHGYVGAPLDGGLLTVLGAAGIAYVAARKKRKEEEE